MQADAGARPGFAVPALQRLPGRASATLGEYPGHLQVASRPPCRHPSQGPSDPFVDERQATRPLVETALVLGPPFNSTALLTTRSSALALGPQLYHRAVELDSKILICRWQGPRARARG